ncbi:hypothetical protein FXO38_25668 [Capsicum annuum]|nr:hypothetical protein FXO37_29344 [Capsicum annuum]KAF3633301.1 hypothetical protein FXO38_25668 [Capsicum annuum]
MFFTANHLRILGWEASSESIDCSESADLQINAPGSNSGGSAGGEDDDNDSQGGVGILQKNLTSSSSALQGMLRKFYAGLADLLPSSAMGQHQRLTRVDGLLNHKNNPDIMLLVAWALTHLVDILPSSCVALLHYGAVLCSLARLLTIEYMDLAEQALKKICQVHPSAFFRAGTLVAVLSYLDFFSARVQVEEFLS